jgi:GMP synthase (glutamine-hydrolysing)
VDSSVAAALLHEAIGTQLIPIFVDTGMMRYDEANRVREMFLVYPDFRLTLWMRLSYFYKGSKESVTREQKRKIIGSTFIDVFEKEAAKFPDAHFLAQGTLYPDVIESVSFAGPSVTIKSHHNVGGITQ